MFGHDAHGYRRVFRTRQFIRGHGASHPLKVRTPVHHTQSFARMVLNVIVNNNDVHLRNHSFIYDVAQRGWRLSPLYDVLPMNLVATERHLHLSVGEQGRLATLDNALSKWPAYVASRYEALAIMHRVWCQTRDWMRHFEMLSASQHDMVYLAGAIRRLSDLASPSLEAELRALSS